jgi:hypothetical protein
VNTATETVLARYPAGGPRGAWPAEADAAAQRDQGTDAYVVMHLHTDQFLVVTDTSNRSQEVTS